MILRACPLHASRLVEVPQGRFTEPVLKCPLGHRVALDAFVVLDTRTGEVTRVDDRTGVLTFRDRRAIEREQVA